MNDEFLLPSFLPRRNILEIFFFTRYFQRLQRRYDFHTRIEKSCVETRRFSIETRWSKTREFLGNKIIHFELAENGEGGVGGKTEGPALPRYNHGSRSGSALLLLSAREKWFPQTNFWEKRGGRLGRWCFTSLSRHNYRVNVVPRMARPIMTNCSLRANLSSPPPPPPPLLFPFEKGYDP